MSPDSSTRTVWTKGQRLLIYIPASGFLLLALRWLHLFALTDYRIHSRFIILPLALLLVWFSISLFRLSTASIALLLILAALTGAAALVPLILHAVFDPFLAGIAFSSGLYLWCLCRAPQHPKRALLVLTKPRGPDSQRWKPDSSSSPNISQR